MLQDPAPASVLRARAEEKAVDLIFVPVNVSTLFDTPALEIPVHKMVNAFLERQSQGDHRSMSEQDMCRGVKRFTWPERFKTIVEGNSRWFLDGAHSSMSKYTASY